MSATDALRQARDKAQIEYAHTRQRATVGSAAAKQLDAVRGAYLLAQSELRAALILERLRGG